jgi:hypothetical protein
MMPFMSASPLILNPECLYVLERPNLMHFIDGFKVGHEILQMAKPGAGK